MDNSEEVWLPVPGLDGRYEASSHGRIRSMVSRYGPRPRPWVLKPGRSPKGYENVNLAGVQRSVHSVILETFVGPRPEGMQCCHRDNNPGNNRVENLRWDTQQANIDDRQKAGRTARGSRSGAAKFSEADVHEIRRRSAAGERMSAIAASMGVPYCRVRGVVSGRTWAYLPN